jgi:pantoate kinase
MRRVLAAIGGAALGSLLLVATVAAADPTPPGRGNGATTGIVAQVLNLTQSQLRELRQDGLSIAQIATRQNVAVQKVVDALVAQWNARIQLRVQNGALTPAEAATLQAELAKRAQDMVSSTTPGGMRGAAVGAGPNGARDGSGPYGDGTCDGTGPHGPGDR